MKKELSRLKKRISSKIDEYSARLIEISEFIHEFSGSVYVFGTPAEEAGGGTSD
jgi:hypothetical protein